MKHRNSSWMSNKSDGIHNALYFILEIAVFFSVFSRFMLSYLSFFYTELRGRFFYTIPPPPSKSANIIISHEYNITCWREKNTFHIIFYGWEKVSCNLPADENEIPTVLKNIVIWQIQLSDRLNSVLNKNPITIIIILYSISQLPIDSTHLSILFFDLFIPIRDVNL